MTVAPIVINFLIECATTQTPGVNIWPGGWDSPAGQQTREFLQNNGLVDADYAPTARARAWLDAILSVPMPVDPVNSGDSGHG
jgi:hypothetical protein